MKIQNNPAALAEKIQRASDWVKEQNPRADGVHVSDLIGCRRKAWYRRNGYAQPEHSTNTQLMFLLGQGHHVLMQQEREEIHPVHQFGGVTVTGSVDDLFETDGRVGPEEYKTTRSSSGKSPYPAIHYVEQLATYALMMGVDFGRITVFYLFGDWKGAKFPQGKTFDIFFDPYEMSDWEVELTRRAQTIVADEPPGFDEKRDWECNYCPFSQKRGGPCAALKGNQPEFFIVDEEVLEALED